MTYPDAYLNHYAEIEGTKMKIEITIPAAHVSAIKLFAAKKDVRYYLNGLLLELGRHESRLVATDGHTLAALRIECDQPAISEPISVIIPNEGLAHVKKKGDVTVSVGGDASDASHHAVTVEYGGVTWSGISVDGKYPNWRTVVPSTLSRELAQFNPHYMALFQDAAMLLRGRLANATFAHNGTNPALVDIGHGDFFGIIMPLRAEPVFVPPAWATRDVTLPSMQVAA